MSGIAEPRKPPWGASPPGAEAVIVKVQGDYFLDYPHISGFLQDLRNARQPLSRSSAGYLCSINAKMCFFLGQGVPGKKNPIAICIYMAVQSIPVEFLKKIKAGIKCCRILTIRVPAHEPA
jgi:hypothetical protein